MVDVRILTEMLSEDADRIVEGIKREYPRMRVEYLKRQSDIWRKI